MNTASLSDPSRNFLVFEIGAPIGRPGEPDHPLMEIRFVLDPLPTNVGRLGNELMQLLKPISAR